MSQTPKHITWPELNDDNKFEQLLPGKKRLIEDAVNMTACRAETEMAAVLTSTTIDLSMARQLLQLLFVTEADILPDKGKKTTSNTRAEYFTAHEK